MKSRRGVFSDIISLDAYEEVIMMYQFKINIKYFYNFTCPSLFNFTLMALILLQFQKSDVDQTTPSLLAF